MILRSKCIQPPRFALAISVTYPQSGLSPFRLIQVSCRTVTSQSTKHQHLLRQYISIYANKIHHIITISCITSSLFPVSAASETAFTACKQVFLQSAGRGFQIQPLLCIDKTQHLPSLSHNVYKKMCSCAKPHKYGLPGFLHEILHQFHIKSLIFLIFCCLSCIYAYLILHSSCITPGVIQSIFSIHKKRSDHRIPPDTECSLRP